MIDLHCHILPGIDDGARDLPESIGMARAMVAQGVTAVACTPHITPGLYHNLGPAIKQATRRLQQELERNDIPLQLVTGADVHMTPNVIEGLRSGQILSLGDTRYVSGPIISTASYLSPISLYGRWKNSMRATSSSITTPATVGIILIRP